MDFSLINVGIADLGISQSPNILRTILGSCVGICLYDPKSKTGGISHIMLPVRVNTESSRKKYADTAIPLFIEELEKKGIKKKNIIAKIVGGATMFQFSDSSMMSEIGKNNIVKVKEVLKGMDIDIVSEDVGGNYGRTIDFYLETGEVKVKSRNVAIKVL